MVNKWASHSKKIWQEEKLLLIVLLVLIGLELLVRKPLYRFPKYVDWKTIITLTGLLLITTAIKESGFFYWLAYRVSKRIYDERKLALFLIFASALLSMFLTNDITLFIVVPLTLSLQEISGEDYVKFIVFEAIAVNAGSSLTAVGNPQNIFIWHQWKVSFFHFITKLTPLVLILGFWLFVFVYLAFKSRPIHSFNQQLKQKVNRSLFWISVVLFVLFILSVELHYDGFFLAILFLSYFLLNKPVIRKADWVLIFLFIIIFIDVHLMYRLPLVNHFLTGLNLANGHTLFFTGTLLSQCISNVPAAILLAKYSRHYQWIAYAVNVGGNGILIASFANLIALRFVQNSRKYRFFHQYSLLYFVVTALSVYVLLM